MSERRVVSNFRTTPEMIRASRKRKLRTKRIIVEGTIIGLTAGVVGLGIIGCNNIMNEASKSDVSVVTTSVLESHVIKTSTEDLSSLNVVLVNDGISDEQMKQAEDSLEATGLDVEVRDINELNKDGTECFVALTNYGGDDYKVIGNYNKGNNHADLLAIGMKEAFGGNIQKGVYAKDEAAPILIPSNIENAVDNQAMPNVTIAVPESADLEDYSNGTSIKVDTGMTNIFTDSLLEGLARYNDSLKFVDINDEEFLLRPSDAEDYNKCLDNDVLRKNKLDNSYEIQRESILLNKGLPDSFNKDADINIEMVNIKGNYLN